MTSIFSNNFTKAMKENEPLDRAILLSSAYRTSDDDFKRATPDQILVDEFGPEVYVFLANKKLVPIAAVPAGIMLG